MMTFIKRIIVVLFVFIALVLFGLYRYYINDVLRYEPLIHEDLKAVGLEEYTPLLLGLVMQETKGKGRDPMQASESLGLAKEAIKDPEKSVEQGVRHFSDVYAYGQKQHVDLATIVQSYNMGISYIDYVKQHGGHHTQELAKSFSLAKVKANPNLYTCKNNPNNFRYPYCYGDFTYSDKVLKKAKYFELYEKIKYRLKQN
jgi:hypothetical protein